MLLRRLVHLTFALVSGAAFAYAGSVRIAERPLLGPFTTLQAAVDAALEGESLLVTPGAYASFTIDGKSVSVLVGGTGTVTITGNVVVKNLAPTQYVVLSGLIAKASFAPGNAALEISNVGGHVRVNQSKFEGNSSSGTGARVLSSVNTVFSGCQFKGGYPGFVAGGQSVDGGIGLDSLDSSIVMYDCVVQGGQGSDESTPFGGAGGDGYVGLNYGLFASGCSFKGGQGGGGDFTGCFPGGIGGDALVIDSGQAHLLANTYAAGPGGWFLCGPNSAPGQTIVPLNGSFINQISGTGRKISAPRVTADDVSLGITISGQPGDSVFLIMARKPSWVFKLSLNGVWMIPIPHFSSALATGTIGQDGTLVIPRTFDIPDGSLAAKLYWLQAVCIDTAGRPTLTGPAQVLSIDTAGAPKWYVDASAGPGGNGSQAAPFNGLLNAVASSFHGDTIVMADGLYQGSSNRAINMAGRSMKLRSANGPGNCTIDCQGAARALSINLGEQVTIEGLTFVNGFTTNGGGGSIETRDALLALRNCVFTSNVCNVGGALRISLGSLRMENCTFLANLAPNPMSGLGGALSIDRAVVTGRDCLFAYNVGANGGAVNVEQSTVETQALLFTHCSFIENQAVFGGACLAMPGSAGTTHTLDDCLFAGNRASTDGAAVMGHTSVAITNSSFVSNSAIGRGGALYLLHGTSNSLRNSIAFGNTAGQGAQIFLGDGSLPTALLSVSYSDVQGGQAAVWLSQGNLSWGSGNLDIDPQFTDADGPDNNAATFSDNDYSLGSISPCIDAGDNGALISDVLDVDADGNTSELVPLDLWHMLRRVDVSTIPDTGAGIAPIVDMGALERPG